MLVVKPSDHMAVDFDRVVPWGRLRQEYELMFKLTAADLAGGVLDCGGGPASFTAELSTDGYRAVSVDPIYACSGSEIRSRFEAAAGPMLTQIRDSPNDWVWNFHRNPDHLLANRRLALDKFLADYDSGLRQRRYIIGELPALPFAPGSFGIAVCSHLLFLYSDLLSADFHVLALRELCRVAREVRVFPLLTLKRERSPHLRGVRSELEKDGRLVEVVRVDYELQRGGNEMLTIIRK